MMYREIQKTDIENLFRVRVATRENRLSREELVKLGITDESLNTILNTTHRGWLCEENDNVVGFAMGNSENGEMWVIALLPNYEGNGIGAKLLILVEDWLWSKGWNEIW